MFPENCRQTEVTTEDNYFNLYEMLPPKDFTGHSSLVPEALTYTTEGKAVRTMTSMLTQSNEPDIYILTHVTWAEWVMLKDVTTLDLWNERIAEIPPLETLCPSD